jgi:hypothetical protein
MTLGRQSGYHATGPGELRQMQAYFELHEVVRDVEFNAAWVFWKVVNLQSEPKVNHILFLRQIGRGKAVYAKAKGAINTWQHLDLGWVDSNRPKVNVGEKLCIAAHLICVWMRNPLQLVYAQERSGKVPRHVGNHYAKLPGSTVKGTLWP